ncbi:MAG: roadblock/LC7 domain-containing protein [Promethearchaeota archaeon]|nr:MAG: roadblock/LC7 domain-containing protein [Candidatus Lokiarchaeota archaeon]
MINRNIFQATLKKLQQFEGVRGVIVTNIEGLPISSTYETEQTEKIAAHITSLVGKCKNVVGSLKKDENDKMSFITITTGEGEILVAPEDEYILIVQKDHGVQIF